MSWRAVRTIALKDLKEVRQNRAAWIPMLVVPLVFVVLLPLLLVVLPTSFDPTGEELRSSRRTVEQMLTAMPPALAGLTDQQRWVVLSAGYLLAPLFLVLPLMFSAIAGAVLWLADAALVTLSARSFNRTDLIARL